MVMSAADIDNKILRLADTHSPEEISKSLGNFMTPARVRLRLQELVGKNGRSWLDDRQREEILMLRMQKMVSEFEEVMSQGFSLEHAKVYLTYLREVGTLLERRAKAREVDLNALYGNQAQIMFEAIKMAMRSVVDEIQRDAPEVSEATARRALGEALPKAVVVISERNLGDEVKA